MSIYPKEISEVISEPQHFGPCEHESASGRSVNFECGCFVSASVSISPEQQTIDEIRFMTNGCGYMIAAGEIVAQDLEKKPLRELHGLDPLQLDTTIVRKLGVLQTCRVDCTRAVIEALRSAFYDHRTTMIEEFSGEKMLVCTCFGVTEEAMIDLIKTRSPDSVEQVMDECRAGSGCGSCRMLIQEMIDIATIYANESPAT